MTLSEMHAKLDQISATYDEKLESGISEESPEMEELFNQIVSLSADIAKKQPKQFSDLEPGMVINFNRPTTADDSFYEVKGFQESELAGKQLVAVDLSDGQEHYWPANTRIENFWSLEAVSRELQEWPKFVRLETLETEIRGSQRVVVSDVVEKVSVISVSNQDEMDRRLEHVADLPYFRIVPVPDSL